jgi:hypothetical protein
MKVRNKISLVGVAIMATVVLAFASVVPAVPGDKRTILTSGEKVYTVRYQLGQSTVLYFGIPPETVICGNKNYFNIEKIKNGITIQPLSNFSTNLTILTQGRRYLFYLTPAGSMKPDGFIEAKWVPTNQARPVTKLASAAIERVREIGSRTKIGVAFALVVLREKSLQMGKRRIFELELKNLGEKDVSTNELEIVGSQGRTPLQRQVVVWESDCIKRKQALLGRLIISDGGNKAINIVVRFQGKNTKIIVKGERN